MVQNFIIVLLKRDKEYYALSILKLIACEIVRQ